MSTVKSGSIALFYLTPGDARLAERLVAMLPLACYTNEALQEAGSTPFSGSFVNAAHGAFGSFSALIFTGTTEIAVRVLVPLVNGKFSDPAAVVTNECARHVISLLSGHAGGANALAHYLAGMFDTDLVITTAADANELAALDTLAFQLNTRMTDSRTAVKTVSQMLVSGMWVGLRCGAELTEALSRCDQRGLTPVSDPARLPAFDALICVTLCRSLPPLPVPHWKLVPQRVVAGTGCRCDTPCSLLCSLLDHQLATRRLDPLALKAIGNMNLKANEPGLCQLIHRCRVPFGIFSAETLREHEHRFSTSPSAREMTSVGSASGPVAWLLSQENLSGKALREQGVTITLGVTH